MNSKKRNYQKCLKKSYRENSLDAQNIVLCADRNAMWTIQKIKMSMMKNMDARQGTNFRLLEDLRHSKIIILFFQLVMSSMTKILFTTMVNHSNGKILRKINSLNGILNVIVKKNLYKTDKKMLQFGIRSERNYAKLTMMKVKIQYI